MMVMGRCGNSCAEAGAGHGVSAATGDLRQARARHLVQMLLGIFAAHDVLPYEVRPVGDVLDLIAPHLEALEAEAGQKEGGVGGLLRQHFARVYKRALPPELVAASGDRR